MADRSDRPLPDDAARRAIREDLGSSMLVEAAAGTGKTTSLIARMTELVRRGTNVERISAVTFTIKAAAELSERFQSSLEESARAAKNPEERRRFEDALARLDSSFVGTIHAFCARLLRERPVEARVDPGFAEMDDPENAAERIEAWARWCERLFTNGDEILARLAALRVRLDDLQQTFDSISDNEDVPVEIGEESAPPDFSAEREAVDRFLARAGADVPEEMPAGGWNEYQQAVRRALRLRMLPSSEPAAEFAHLLDALSRGRKKPTQAGRLRGEWEGLLAGTVDPGLARWRRYIHPVVMRAVAPAAEEFAEWRRRHARLNFQDLLLLARDLLRDHPGVRHAFQDRFLPILVDEFQDTDPIQAEILFYLTGTDPEEKDWRALTPRAGSLFVVGDPKQSIYRFRRADIETYAAVRRRMEESGRVLTLSANFRSTGTVCDWVNRTFAPMFSSGARGQAPWVPLQAQREPGRPAVTRLLTRHPGYSADAIAGEDSRRIASSIAAAIESGERTPGDFLLLFRTRTHMPTYARALESRGIPYALSAGGAFADSEELRTLLPLLQTIADPDDPVSCAAVLRGPLFGVDDAALYRHARAGGRFSFRAPLPESPDARIAAAFSLLAECEVLSQTLPPGAAISRIAGRLGYTAAASSRDLGDSRAGNLLKAIAAARTLSSSGLDFCGVVAELSRLTRKGSIEEMSAEPGRRGVVRLMTVHGAKGLEAPVVFLADPRRPPKYPVRYWIDRAADAKGHWRAVKETDNFGVVEIAEPPGWEEMEELECAFEEAEKARLLYVAATRAREALVVSVFKQAKSDNAQGPWQSLDAALREDLHEALHLETAASWRPLGDLSGERRAFAESLSERRLRSSTPGYAASTVTALTHAAGEKPAWESTGRGMSWGRVLHGVLEAMMRDPGVDVRAVAANLLTEEERPAGELDEVVRLARDVEKSALWARARASKRTLVEVPFAIDVPREELGLSEGPPRSLLHGAIDLVFEEDDGWVLVDYKSDAVTPENRSGLVAFYTRQIDTYRRYWRRLTGKPTRAGIFFAQTGDTEWIPDSFTEPSPPR
jgi:ATP-dependent helicase/nuclease subunit A